MGCYNYLTVPKLSASKLSLGADVTVTASAKGGNSGYTYSVYWKKITATKWVSALKNGNTCRTVITPVKAGSYDACVKVKDLTGIVKKEYFNFEVSDFQAKVVLVNQQITLGQKETITASVTNSSVSCQYAVYYKKTGDSKYQLVQNYQTNQTVSLLPKEAGSYEVCVKAKNNAGHVRKAYAAFTVNPAITVTQKLSAKTASLGKTITVTPSSAGGTGTIKYAVYYTKKTSYDAGNPKWITAHSYGQQGAASITPDKAGVYVVVTKAKDTTGSIAKSAYVTFEITEPLVAEGSFKNQQSTVYPHTPAIFIASARGGTGGYTYALKFREKGTANWNTLRDYGTDPQFRIEKNAMGNYRLSSKNNFELMILVKDAKGQTAGKIYSFTVSSSDQYELPIIPAN